MARLSVKLRKEMVRGLPTWVTDCSRCGAVSRNWYRPSAVDVQQMHRRKHARSGR